jgi:hypothetical protein
LYRYLGPKSTAYQQHLKNAVLNTSTEVPSVGPENSAYLETSKINSPSSTFDQSFVGFSLSSRVVWWIQLASQRPASQRMFDRFWGPPNANHPYM